jgi:urease accessory protein
MKTTPRPLASLSVPAVAVLLTLFAAKPAQAHHLMGGRMASTAFEGFMSGIAHPVIGIDHLAMIVAIGVLAAAIRSGFALAGIFVLAAMVGTGLHLLRLNLPGSEALVALSVLAAGALIALRKTPNRALVFGIGAVAGVLHGYAYGESIFGAESTPLVAYLVGFTAVQLVVAGIAYAIAKHLRDKSGEQALILRPAGFVVAGAGLALLATQLVTMAFPIH